MFIPCLSLKPLLSAAKTQQASCSSTTRFMLELQAVETWCPQRLHLLQLWRCLRVALVVFVHQVQHLMMRTSMRSRRGEETQRNGDGQALIWWAWRGETRRRRRLGKVTTTLTLPEPRSSNPNITPQTLYVHHLSLLSQGTHLVGVTTSPPKC